MFRQVRRRDQPSSWWAVRNDLTQGDERGTYVTLETFIHRETRDRLRVRTYGDGATIVVVGVTPHHGGGNTAVQGEGWQVTTRPRRGGTRDADSRNRPEPQAGHWRAS